MADDPNYGEWRFETETDALNAIWWCLSLLPSLGHGHMVTVVHGKDLLEEPVSWSLEELQSFQMRSHFGSHRGRVRKGHLPL